MKLPWSTAKGSKSGKDVPCKQCGKVRYLRPSEIGKKSYCSRACMTKAYRYDEQRAIAEFWLKVDASAGDDGCWIWTGAYRYDGYGHVNFMGKQSAAHQRSYRIVHGEPPKGMWVLHNCDNRKCVNPAHLRAGTVKDNHQDMVDRGRARYITRHKLTPDQVRAIRREYRSTGYNKSNSRELAEKYGVGLTTITEAVAGRTWRNV